MKIISYTALLYGVQYLEWAIRSVIDAVDEHYIIYSPVGAHGHKTDIPCPETREQLLAAAQRGAGDKLRWIDAGPFPYEGAQREYIHTLVPDADGILVVDADEVWSYGAVRAAQYAIAFGKTKRYRVPMWHYWRSFYRCVKHDPAFPIRVICPQREESTAQIDCHSLERCRIHHFGYAQSAEIVGWKLQTHGHRNEFRRDVDWYSQVFMTNRQYDCHPVGSEFWQPEPIMPLEYLPSWMAQHPYYGLEIIP